MSMKLDWGGKKRLPSFHTRPPPTSTSFSPPSFLPTSLSLQALNRIRASHAKWNVWRKPQPWNKAQETGRDGDRETVEQREADVCIVKDEVNGRAAEVWLGVSWIFLSITITNTHTCQNSYSLCVFQWALTLTPPHVQPLFFSQYQSSNTEITSTLKQRLN